MSIEIHQVDPADDDAIRDFVEYVGEVDKRLTP